MLDKCVTALIIEIYNFSYLHQTYTADICFIAGEFCFTLSVTFFLPCLGCWLLSDNAIWRKQTAVGEIYPHLVSNCDA